MTDFLSRSKVIEISVTEKEGEAVEYLAKLTGTTVATYVRMLIQDELDLVRISEAWLDDLPEDADV